MRAGCGEVHQIAPDMAPFGFLAGAAKRFLRTAWLGKLQWVGFRPTCVSAINATRHYVLIRSIYSLERMRIMLRTDKLKGDATPAADRARAAGMPNSQIKR